MNQLQIRKFGSTEELRSVAAAWDDLWLRSEVTNPRARAHLVALWVEHFSPGEILQALAVEQDGKLVAALPLVGSRRLKGLVKVGALPYNASAGNGDLLLDPTTDIDAVLDLLVSAFNRLPWPFLWLDSVALERSHWQALRAAMNRKSLSPEIRLDHHAALIEIGDDWQAYEASRSIKHRQNRRRRARKLEEAGKTELKIYSQLSPAQVEALLLPGFEVEDRSWKGSVGTSVLKTPGMFDFYCREAAILAEQGQLQLVFLEHQDKPIAFDYGLNAKGVHFIPKIGYDEAYEKFGPGQLLMMRLLQHLHDDPKHHWLDFLGLPDPWKLDWANCTYAVGSIIAPTGRPLSKEMFQLYTSYTNGRSYLQQFRQKRMKDERVKDEG